jgi:ATP phosphoribosyltransferase
MVSLFVFNQFSNRELQKKLKMKIAIQKSGRLYDESIKLLKECGIGIAHSKNQLRVLATNFDLEIFFLRDDDIPQYVADKVADIGIVGQNVLLESGYDVNTVENLGFGKCRLSIAISKNETYNNVNDLNGKKIATTYPKILQNFLNENKVTAEIHVISGSVEIAPKIGLADAICDLVSTGSTLFMNELKEVQNIFSSEAVLIANKNLTNTENEILQKLLFRINAVKKAADFKYILLNAPNNKLEAIYKLLPSMRSPTVLPLAESGWSSVHSVVAENDFWNKIELLKANGAEGILVVPIEKMIV